MAAALPPSSGTSTTTATTATRTGTDFVLSWADLKGFGINDGPQWYTSRPAAAERHHPRDRHPAAVCPGQPSPRADRRPATVAEGTPYALQVYNRGDSGNDTLTSVLISWGDGRTARSCSTRRRTTIREKQARVDAAGTRHRPVQVRCGRGRRPRTTSLRRGRYVGAGADLRRDGNVNAPVAARSCIRP